MRLAGFTPEDALWNSSRRKKRERSVLAMRVQPYSQRKEDVSCAGFIQPPGRVYCIPPPSNPRLDGQRIYTDFAKYACFFHRPALGWTVTHNTFPALKTCRKCQRSLLSLFTNRLPMYAASKLPSAERILRAVLGLVAATTKVFYTMNEEVLEAVVDESDEPVHIRK